MEHHNLQELIVAIERLTMQVGRLVSDFESEKGIRKEMNAEMYKRMDAIEAWKNKWHGAFIAMSIIVTALTILSFFIKFK